MQDLHKERRVQWQIQVDQPLHAGNVRVAKRQHLPVHGGELHVDDLEHVGCWLRVPQRRVVKPRLLQHISAIVRQREHGLHQAVHQHLGCLDFRGREVPRQERARVADFRPLDDNPRPVQRVEALKHHTQLEAAILVQLHQQPEEKTDSRHERRPHLEQAGVCRAAKALEELCNDAEAFLSLRCVECEPEHGVAVLQRNVTNSMTGGSAQTSGFMSTSRNFVHVLTATWYCAALVSSWLRALPSRSGNWWCTSRAKLSSWMAYTRARPCLAQSRDRSMSPSMSSRQLPSNADLHAT